jgi:hypothetical protein
MSKEFEVRWEGVLPADPRQAWDAITRHTGGWLWEIDYEPRVGGAERGLTSGGGTVAAWDPPRHFQTRAERPDGWFNVLDYVLEPRGDGTLLRYTHTSVLASDFDAQYDQCAQHTAFYYHSLGEYLRHFAGRDAAYATFDVPGSFATVRDRVRERPELDATVDYETPAFLGLRTHDALIRVYGRDAWGGPVGIGLHLFADGADAAAAQRSWAEWLAATEAVA